MTKSKLILRPFIALILFTSLASSGAQAATTSDINWSVSGPLTLVEGEALWGAYVTGLYRLTPEFSVGGESGFQIGSQSFGTVSATMWNIPILVTGLYHFDIAGAGNIKPFVGAGIGLAILHGGVSGVTVPAGTSTSSTSAKFEGLAHLGANFGATPGFMADIRIGFLDSSFVFAPTVGYAF
jgi:hypothetical protein